MSNLKDTLKSAGLVGSFGQVIETGSAAEESCSSCEYTCQNGCSTSSSGSCASSCTSSCQYASTYGCTSCVTFSSGC